MIDKGYPPPATLLELGCGVGRLTHPLAKMGYQVTAVDNSEAMLRNVNSAIVVLSDVESLKLNQYFEVVLLASRLLNIPNKEVRAMFLNSVRRHLKEGSAFIAEVHSPQILRHQAGDHSEGQHYGATIKSSDVVGSIARITIEYRITDQVWTQSFETEYLKQQHLERELAACGLHFVEWIDDEKTWLKGAAV